MCGERFKRMHRCPKCKDSTFGNWLCKRITRPKNVDKYCLTCAMKQDEQESREKVK